MSTTYEARGLTADWLNGWLAAIGAAVVIPGLHVAWSDDLIPVATFEHDEELDLAVRLANAIPTEATLAGSVIARSYEGCRDFPRKVPLEAYVERAGIERALRTAHLASSVSDLRNDADQQNLDHGAFDVSAPRGETLWSRAVSCARAIPDGGRAEWVGRSLSGTGSRVQVNGLGFDPRRLPSGVQGSGVASKVHVDPVVELLCFVALALFPTRGDGHHIRQRSWTDRATQTGAFEWMAWRPSLDQWAIDAFLDERRRDGIDVIARYSVVPYQATARADPTRAYFARRLP